MNDVATNADNNAAHTSDDDRMLGKKYDLVSPVKPEDIEVSIEDDLPKKPEPGDKKESKPHGKQYSREDIDEDVPDEELDSYSETVKKRMATLTYRMREAERQAEEAKLIENNAVQYADRLTQENNHVKGLLNQGEEVLLNQIRARAEQELLSAKRSYANAFEEGKTDEVVESQEKMIKAQAELNQVMSRIQQQNAAKQRMLQNPQPQPRYAPPQRPQQQQLSKRQQEWFAENTWFNNPENRDMTGFAYGVHEKLVNSGVPVNSERYYESIDREVQSRFPEYFNQDKQGNTQTVTSSVSVNAPSTVVAPSSRGSGGSTTQSVTLKASEVALAKRLGITPQQYAANKLKGGQ